MTRIAWLSSLTVSLTASLGCDVETHFVDPAVIVHEAPLLTKGPPSVVLGYYTTTTTFVPLSAGKTVTIVRGQQGGFWSMPAVRTTGIGSPSTVECSIVTAANETVGTQKTRTKFFPSKDGALEYRSFPISVKHAPPREKDPIDDLTGQDAKLQCTVSDKDLHTATQQIDVRLNFDG